jgi:hypothetical protein
MQVVGNMSVQPGHCGICRQTPTDHEGNPVPCIDTDVDINWGENLYICHQCANVIGVLIGNEDKDVAAQLRADLAQAEKAVEELTAENDTLQARIDRMIDGVRARKEAKTKKKVSS